MATARFPDGHQETLQADLEEIFGFTEDALKRGAEHVEIVPIKDEDPVSTHPLTHPASTLVAEARQRGTI